MTKVAEIEGKPVNERSIGRRVRVIPQDIQYGYPAGRRPIDHPSCWDGEIVGVRTFARDLYRPAVIVKHVETGEQSDQRDTSLRWLINVEGEWVVASDFYAAVTE